MAGEELISAGESKRPGIVATAATAIFLMATVGTGIVDGVFPRPAPKVLGTEAAAEARKDAAARFWDGTKLRRIEDRLKGRSRIRAAVGPWAALAALKLGHLDADRVVLGKDGWLFLGDGYRTDEVLRVAGPAIASDLLTAARRRFATAGSRLIALPLARKEVMCRQYIDRAWGDAGFDFDEKAFAQFRAHGLEYIDTLETWQGLEPREVYRKYDNHWAFPAEVALVDAIVERFPELVTHELDVDPELVLGEADYRENLLDMAGIDSDHPAVSLLDRDRLPLYRLEPPELEEMKLDRATYRDIALAGSSFTDGYSVWSMLVDRLERPLLHWSFSGTQFMLPLGLLVNRARVVPFPSTVLYEFPLAFVNEAPRRGVEQARGVGKVFEELRPGAVVTLAELDGFVVPGQTRVDARGWLRASIPAAYALGDGEGAVGLEVAPSPDVATDWIVRTSDVDMFVRVDAGEGSFVVPLVTGAMASAPIEVLAANEAARNSALGLRIVADVDPASTPATALERTARGWSAEGPFDAGATGPMATLVVRADGDVRGLSVRVEGALRGGAPHEVRYDRPGTALPLAFVGLAGFEGGRIDAIHVEAPGATGATIGFAPLPVQAR